MGQIDNELSLVQVMVWRRVGDKPSSEPMVTQFTVRNIGISELTLRVVSHIKGYH